MEWNSEEKLDGSSFHDGEQWFLSLSLSLFDIREKKLRDKEESRENEKEMTRFKLYISSRCDFLLFFFFTHLQELISF